MTTPALFTGLPDDMPDPYEAIAARVECNICLVDQAFRGLAVPNWSSRQHLASIRATTFALNEAERYATNLIGALKRLHPEQRDHVTECGTPTIAQIELLAAVLRGDVDDLNSWRQQYSAKGGRDPAAYIVAEATRRLFRRLRRKITFGQHRDGGPSTDFGRTVEFAIGAFGLLSDWRQPTKNAHKRQQAVEARHSRCARMKFERDMIANPPEQLDMSGIAIDLTVLNGMRIAVIRLENRDEVPPLLVDYRTFKSGQKLRELARGWAVQNGLKRP